MKALSENQVLQAEEQQSPSIALLEGRKKLGLNQKEVAEKLFLTTTIVNYLERGEFHLVPRTAFVKGYLRSYARFLGLNDDYIVSLYEDQLQGSSRVSEIGEVGLEKVGPAYITGSVLQAGFLGLGLMFFVIGLVWWQAVEEEPEPRVPVVWSEDTGGELQVRMSPVLDPFGDTGLTSPSGTEISKEEIVDNFQSDFAVEKPFDKSSSLGFSKSENKEEGKSIAVSSDEVFQSDNVTESITIERNVNGFQNYITVDAGGMDEIRLTFTEDCWVEVSDGLHGRVYFDLNVEGDVLTVAGSQPFEVLLGKATGVKMLYNGSAFDLDPYIGRDNTAKVTVSD